MINPNCRICAIILTRPNVPAGISIRFPYRNAPDRVYKLTNVSVDGMRFRYVWERPQAG